MDMKPWPHLTTHPYGGWMFIDIHIFSKDNSSNLAIAGSVQKYILVGKVT